MQVIRRGLLVFFICLSLFPGQAEASVRVGLFENNPLCFTGPDGQILGVFPDLIREIAAKEGWEIEFVPDTWAGCLSALESGRIDLMMSIVPTRDREALFDFSALPVVTAWGQVYTLGTREIISILDLDQRKVGVVEKDISGSYFRQLAEQLKIEPQIRTFPVYGDLCQALRQGELDAVVMNNLNGAVYQDMFRLFPTAILFNPVSGHFAVRRGADSGIIIAVNLWLDQWKSDKDSVYYAILARWCGTGIERQNRYLTWAVAISCGIALIAVLLLVMNRRLGRRLSHHIQELEQTSQRYQALSDKALVGIFRTDRQGNLRSANRKMAEILGFPAIAALKERHQPIQSLFADPAQFNAIKDELDRTGVVEGRLVELETRNQQRIWGNLHLRQDKDPGGEVFFEGFLEDVSSRHRKEQLLRARLALSQMSGDCTTKELLQAFLAKAEELTGSNTGFFHFLPDNQDPNWVQTWSSRTLATMDESRHAHEPEAKARAWADTILSMEPVIHNDYPSISYKNGLPEGHPPIHREMVIPVVRNQKVRAVLGVGNKTLPYNDRDIGTVRELVDTAWEIIVKNQALNALWTSETRYRQFIETAVEGIWVLDRHQQTTFANATMAEKLGTVPETLMGNPMDAYIFPQDTATHCQWLADCSQGIRQRHEARFRKIDGSEFWAIVSASPLETPEGNFDGIFAMFTDITDRKQAEQEIEQTHQRLLAILNGIESTIYVADMTTHEILFMNDYMKQLFGKDHTGDLCWKAFRNQDKPCPHCTNPFLLDKTGQPTGIHLWEERHPVTGRWNIYHDRAIRWVDGRMARLQIATDVTRMKTMEHQQREFEGQIRQAQKMEALGALAGGIAHDFNNILFPILGYAELLREEFPETSTARKGLEEILKGAGRARDLVEQILTFSRQTETRVAPLKPDLIIKEVIKLIRATLPATIRIKQSIAKDVKLILADPTQFHQVAMNLITNAYHAMEMSGGTLTVTLENGSHPDPDKPGPFVVFSVKDTGIGMDRETREKIFDPYFTTKPEGKGTGLGLSVVHGIVTKYRGDIRVNSEPEQGACFEVFLPAVTRTEAQSRGQDQNGNVGGTERIFLVDDEPQVLVLEKEMLERLGYTVFTQESSIRALETLRTDPLAFDLVITDMTMPEMSGDILTEEIKAVNPHLAVLICTGFSERLNPERIQQLGIRGVLLKPISKADLAKAVRSALDGTAS